MERYEQLRAGAVDGRPAGGLGLALLIARGVAAWARAWPDGAPAPSARRAPAPEGGEGQQIVAVLADMALACLDGR